MYSIIMKIDEEKALKELGQEQLKGIYKKLEKAYVDNVGLIPCEDEIAPPKGYIAYAGNVEYQRIMSVNLAMVDVFKWLKDYLSEWFIFDIEDKSVGNLKEDLLDGE